MLNACCSTVGLPFEESSARSSASTVSHPLSPTSSMDTPTDPSLHPYHNPLNPHHRPQSHSFHHPAHSAQAHCLSRDNSSGTSHSQRTDAVSENGGEKAGLERATASTHESSSHVTDDRGSDRGSDRHAGTAGLKATGVLGSSGIEQSHQSSVQSKIGGRSGTGPQPQQLSTAPPNAASASVKPDSLSAATAAAAAALRPVKHGNGRSQSSSIATGPGKGLVAGHSQALPGHPHTTSGPQAGMANGVSAKPSQQQQSAKQANARTLNGNAAAFVPASISGGIPSISSSLSLTSTGSGTLNGHSGHASHTSYRNAAAGVSTPASAALATTSMALPSGADKGSSSQGSLSPRQSVSSGLHMSEGAAPSSPGGPGVSRGMRNGDGIYSSRGQQPQQSHTVPFTSPDGSKVRLCLLASMHASIEQYPSSNMSVITPG